MVFCIDFNVPFHLTLILIPPRLMSSYDDDKRLWVEVQEVEVHSQIHGGVRCFGTNDSWRGEDEGQHLNEDDLRPLS